MFRVWRRLLGLCDRTVLEDVEFDERLASFVVVPQGGLPTPGERQGEGGQSVVPNGPRLFCKLRRPEARPEVGVGRGHTVQAQDTGDDRTSQITGWFE